MKSAIALVLLDLEGRVGILVLDAKEKNRSTKGAQWYSGKHGLRGLAGLSLIGDLGQTILTVSFLVNREGVKRTCFILISWPVLV